MNRLSVKPSEALVVQNYVAERERRVEALVVLQDCIWGICQKSVSRDEGVARLLESELMGSEDGRAEIVNAIVAAVAWESRCYNTLWNLVEVLTDSYAFKDLAFMITVACLSRFPETTMFFILGLVERSFVDITPVYKLLKRRGLHTVQLGVAFYYFGPELLQKGRDWYVKKWESLQNTRASEIARAHGISANIEVFDWTEHKELRKTGRGSNNMLEAIRNDDGDTFQRLMSASDFRRVITFSMYEQLFKWRYLSVNGTAKDANILQAIGMYGAIECFKVVIMNKIESNMLEEAVESIVNGGNLEMIRYVEDHGMNFSSSLSEAVVTHNIDVFEWLIDGRVDVSPRDAVKAMKYCNMRAFTRILPRLEPGLTEAVFSGKETMFHKMAKHNAIEMFKYVLSLKKDELFPYCRAIRNRTFLHTAAMNGAQEIIEFWCSCYDRIGLDALDDFSYNPHHYAFSLAVQPKTQSESGKSLYDFMLAHVDS